jgi:CHAD domain-containing protein
MRNYANDQLSGRLTRLAFEVRRAARNRRPDDVHDLRVSIRRFLQCLDAFRDCFPTRVAKKCRRRLRGIMELAAAVRDCDVTIALVSEAGAGSRSALLGWLTGTRATAMEALVEELRRLTRREFSRRWRDALELAGKESNSVSAADLKEAAAHAARELPGLAKKFFKRGRLAAAPDESVKTLHEFRLAAKRFRYVVELFRPVYGPGLVERINILRCVQRHLGEVHDCAAARELLERAPAGAARSASAIARRIEALGERRVRAFRVYWKRTLESPLQERNWTAYLARFAGSKLARRRS